MNYAMTPEKLKRATHQGIAICASCHHFRRIGRGSQWDGECRLDPPAVGSRRWRNDSAMLPRWPETWASDWCGQHNWANRERLIENEIIIEEQTK